MDKQIILDAFMFRHACKEFDPKALIPEEDFLFILETARLSPSSFGFEPWQFLVVQDMNLRKKLLPHTWGGKTQIPTASHYLVCLAMKTPLLKFDSVGIADSCARSRSCPRIGSRPARSTTPPFSSPISASRQRPGHVRLGLQAVLHRAGQHDDAAALIGIDSCPIEGFAQDKVDEVLAEDFGVDLNEYGVAYMLAFGYRVKAPKRKTRRPLEQMVSWF
jgi:Nitroreductase